MNHARITRRHAFTLIELLTVIAIIGILAAIIIPTVGRVRASARSIKCVSNLRQIGVASRLYAEENKDLIVPCFKSTYANQRDLRTWVGQLAPYTGWSKPSSSATEFVSFDVIPDVFKCPEKTTKTGSYLGYGYNLDFLTNGQDGSNYRPRYYRQAEHAPTTLMIADGIRSDGKETAWRPEMSRLASTGWMIPQYRHPGDTCNVLWLDGHVSGEKQNARKLEDNARWKMQ
ncbi:hypothetical protein OPIT5_01925 [Opitutaceae bacterium TAV5]|nr:hypothetical protein OPIT5_01925 [Opitutaceae bacterium TAV5]